MIKNLALWVAKQAGNLLTGIDNKTLDPARVGMALALVVLTVTIIYYLVTGVRIQLLEIGEAYGVATAAGAGGAAMTHSSQPKGDGE